jgi:Penicillinase repressor
VGDQRWRAWREFGELEKAIMEVVWAGDGPYVVREVRERLRYGRPGAYTTVREDHDARLMAEVLRSGGDEDVTMRRFLERVNDDEMESLCSALGDARSRRLTLR